MVPDEREKHVIGVEMQHVELAGTLPYLLQHQYIVGEWIADLRIETQASLGASDKFRRSLGVTAGKQGDLMTLPYEFLRDVGDDPFGPPVQLWRHRFYKGCNLCDFHAALPSSRELDLSLAHDLADEGSSLTKALAPVSSQRLSSQAL